MGLSIFMAVLLIHLNGPIIFMAGAADKLEWAHYILWQVPIMSLNGPIIFMAGAADKLEWAHYVLWQVLLISLNWPIYFYGRCYQEA